jgi:hypothetical protein
MPIGDAGNQITIWSIVSLLVGTIISAIVSYLLQRTSFAEARRVKAQEKLEERKTLGLTLLHKMIRMTSTLQILKDSLDEAFADAKANSITGQPWQFVMPVVNFLDRVKFTPEELTFLMLLDRNLFNDFGPFDDIHNNLLGVFELYRTKRSALTDILPAEMKGNLGTTGVSLNEILKLAPKAAELDFLIEGMVQRTRQDSKEAWELLDRLQKSLNKEFNLNLRIVPK